MLHRKTILLNNFRNNLIGDLKASGEIEVLGLDGYKCQFITRHISVRFVGVCMTAQIMLVTPYMPLGCLLDYVRKNQENIGSKVLLDWCTQIASVSS